MSRRRREMYCGHARLCVCLPAAACPHYRTDPDVTWGSGRGCHLVVHYWADLQSVHGLRCYGNITRTRNVSEYMLVVVACLVTFRVSCRETTRNVLWSRASVCLSVRGRMPTLLHGPGCNSGEWKGMLPSYALLGGFAIGARVAMAT